MIIPPAFQQVQTVLGTARQYRNNATAQNDLYLALARWYQAAKNRQFPAGNAWLQIQAEPLGNKNGYLLYNCGGIHNQGDGGYGHDYVEPALALWLETHLTVPIQGAQNGQVTFEMARETTPQKVGTNNGQSYFQDYYVVKCRVCEFEYNQTDSTKKVWENKLKENFEDKQLYHGCNYTVILNFHLYEDGPHL